MTEVTPAGVREDFKNLMHKFSSLRSFDFQEFSDTWNALKFYCLYWKAMEIRITHGELKEYDPMESFMKLCMMDAFHYVCCKDQVFAENSVLSTQVNCLSRNQTWLELKHKNEAKSMGCMTGIQACAQCIFVCPRSVLISFLEAMVVK